MQIFLSSCSSPSLDLGAFLDAPPGVEGGPHFLDGHCCDNGGQYTLVDNCGQWTMDNSGQWIMVGIGEQWTMVDNER